MIPDSERPEPIPPLDEPDDYPLEPRCYCGRLLEYGFCSIHRRASDAASADSDA